MGSPISSMIAEIYLQYLEETYMKHCLEHKQIMYYKRYVDDILIIFDSNKIHNNINNIDQHLEFKLSNEENRTINYLDLTINRETNKVNLSTYRKPTYIDIAIHASSNHPYDHKIAAFKY
jgi:galactitol-specific phosphotransferase system IIB component